MFLKQPRNSKVAALGKALLCASVSLPAALMATQVAAQQITSGVRGTVVGPDGSPVAGAIVTVTDTRKGSSNTTRTNNQGQFSVTGLETGGPYTVRVADSAYTTRELEGLFISISEQASLNIALQDRADSVEEIIVTGVAGSLTELAIGPSANFNLTQLESFPSIDRDIRDVIRIDPRVTINEGNDDSISCLGTNNRFNSFTIDGVRSSDGFGLNASGFPNRNNLPIPFDAVAETAVEFAPFDVEYGSFVGCNINVVTKTGTNEFHGDAFAVFNNGDLTGSKIDGEEVREGSFRDWNWGATLGGPIIKDKLWFFGAYEEVQDGGVIVATGPSGAGFANELDFLTETTANQIADAFQNLYGRDVIGLGRNLPDESRRILGRIDWQITDDHRAAFTYTRLRELRQDPDDGFGFNDFSFLDNFENEGTETESYALRVFSNWTDNLSTELRVSRIDVTDIQGPVGGGEAQDANPIPRIVIDNITNGSASGDLVSGPGFFRSANDLQYQIDQVKFKADYTWGDHTFTAGYELEQLDLFNLFVPDATGTITFDSLADFLAGTASEIEGNGSFTGDINDAAASFSRSIHTLYVQDEWLATDALTIQLGLRYDFYESSDRPIENQVFIDKFGFTNTTSFDSLDVIQPRLGLTYDAGETFFGETLLRGGVGIFSGGDPTVWFANNFQNFGGAIGNGASDSGSCTAADLQVIDGNGNFTGIPQCVIDQQIANASTNQGSVNAVDPDFKIPSLLRLNFGFTHFTDFEGAAGGFFDDWTVQMDIIHSRRRNAVDFVNLALTDTGETAPDGRPIFAAIDPLQAGCNAVFEGIREGFSNVDLSNCGVSFRDDEEILLTNVVGKDGSDTSFSVSLAKRWDYDLGSVPSVFDLTMGYAFTASKLVNAGNSSTASSNFEENATSVLNNTPLAPAQYANRHNFTLAARFEFEFIDENPTTFGLFFNAQSGRPFSYVFDDRSADTFGDSDREARHLFYVPTGPNDPLVDLSGVDQDAFFTFLNDSGLSRYAGQIAPRNEFRDPWFKDLDIRFSQELPGLFNSDGFEVFVDMENFLNLIDSGSNVRRNFDRGDVGEGVPVLNATINDQGQYVYTNFSTEDPAGGIDNLVNSSLWTVQFGVRYHF
ncbi:MAG: TonB-dependent receptor [Sphingomonadales bacterium]|jgi:hypothetical protein